MESSYNEQQTYLILEPYVFYVRNDKYLLLYNTIDGSYIQHKTKNILVEIFNNELCKNIFLIEKRNILQEKEFSKFISEIEEKNIGYQYQSTHAPIQIPPLQNPISEKLNNTGSNEFNDHCLDHLIELSIYLNSGTKNNKQLLPKYYKQITTNSFCNKVYQEINSEALIEFIKPALVCGSLHKINLLGGNVLEYSQLSYVLYEFVSSNKIINLFLNAEEITFNTIDILNKLNFKNLIFTIVLTTNLNETSFNRFHSVVDSLVNLCEVMFQVIIEDVGDIKKFEGLLGFYEQNIVKYYPFYNGDNFKFFEENVFLDKTDILSKLYSFNDLRKKNFINENEFGKIIILPNNNVFCNINQEPIGDIKNVTIQEIVAGQIKGEGTWLNTRSKAKTCKNCIYNCFCPSMSNYELILKRNNLCNIVNN